MIRKAIIVVLTLGAVGIGGACIASHIAPCGGFWELSDTWFFTFDLSNGNASCFVTHDSTAPPQRGFSIGLHPFVGKPSWCDFGVYSYNKRGFIHSGLLFPLWSLLALLAIYPVIAFIRGLLRRWRRRRKGLCIRCGYNLAGNVSRVCPECGEAR